MLDGQHELAGNKKLYFLRRLKGFNVCNKMLHMFCQSGASASGHLYMLLQTECEGAQQVISDWRGSWAGLSGGGDRGEDAVQVGYHPEHRLPPPHLICWLTQIQIYTTKVFHQESITLCDSSLPYINFAHLICPFVMHMVIFLPQCQYLFITMTKIGLFMYCCCEFQYKIHIWCYFDTILRPPYRNYRSSPVLSRIGDQFNGKIRFLQGKGEQRNVKMESDASVVVERAVLGGQGRRWGRGGKEEEREREKFEGE